MKAFLKGGDNVKKLVQRKANETLPADKLRRSVLSTDKQILIGQSGVPETADGLSYEPVQRLLAISSSDGRVKVIGQDGVEKTFVSSSTTVPGRSTQQVHFLPSRGVVVRISQAGSLELWSLDDQAGPDPCPPLKVLTPHHDGLLCMSVINNEPFILLGCVTGAIRVAMLLDAAQSPVDEARPVKGIKLLPYHVSADMMGAKGYVASLAAKSAGPVHRLLVQHSSSDVVVWDLRAGIVAGIVRPSMPDAPCALTEAGIVTCSCWAGGHGRVEEFVTGHGNGDMLAWSLPLLDPVGVPVLLRKLRLVGSEPAASIKHMEYVGNRHGQLLVLGGQHQDAPDSLSLLPVPGLGQGTEDSEAGIPGTPPPEQDTTKVPWFGNVKGYALVPAKGSFSSNDEPGAIIVLLESGQLHVHDLKAPHKVAQPPASLPLQSGPRAVAASLYSLPESRLPGMGVSAATVATLRQLSAETQACKSPTAKQAKPWTWVLAGGEAPKLPSQPKGSPTKEAHATMSWGTVLCSAHEDGTVKMWDMFTEQPRLLLTTPCPQVTRMLPPPTLRGVTCMHLFWAHGLLLTGHERGEVRMYQLNQAAGAVSVSTLEGIGVAEGANLQDLDQPQGFQLRLRLLVHSADITALSYCPGARLAAVADEMGAVSLLNTSRVQLLWYVHTRNQAVRSVEVGMLPMPSKGPGSPTASRTEPACAVVLANDTSELAVLDLDKGQQIGSGWMKPKNLSQVLFMGLLDLEGNPVWMASDRLKSTYGPGLLSEPASGSHSRTGSPSAALVHMQGNSPLSREADREVDETAVARSEAEEDEDDDEFLAKAAEAAGKSSGSGSLKSQAHLDDSKSSNRAKSGLSSRGSATSTPKMSTKTSGWSQMSAFEALVSADSLSLPSDEPEAHCVLVATSEYLRIYSTNQILQADRSTVQKKRLNATALFASTFLANGAPAVAVVVGPVEAASLQVYSLPNLDQLVDVPLSQIMPWAWSWPDVSDPKFLARRISTSHMGQLSFIGRQAELVRLALVANTPRPAHSPSLFDWELANAAHAAQLAVNQAALKHKRHVPALLAMGSGPGRVSVSNTAIGTDSHMSASMGMGGDGRGRQPGLKGLGSVFKLVNAGVNQALTETSKGIHNLVQPKEGGFGDTMDVIGEHYKQYPTLAVIFSRAAADSDSDTEDNQPSHTYAQASANAPSLTTRTSGSHGSSREGASTVYSSTTRGLSINTNTREDSRGPSLTTPKGGHSIAGESPHRGGTSPHESADATNRAELFGATTPAAQGRVRTADEIRAAYGRPPANKGVAATAAATAASSSVFEQTRQALGERGEKLARLQDKTLAMENDAASFAQMAKQLADKEKNRKWWHL